MTRAATPVRDYTTVTETSGTAVTAEALDMLWTRYVFASTHCAGKDVLEVGCGSGQGLAPLAKVARWLVAGDYTDDLLRHAQREYGAEVPLLRLDAERLPFRSSAFDVVIMFEALYYLRDAAAFLRDSARVLRPGGTLLICVANPDRSDFNPSPHSHRYWSAAELRALLEHEGFTSHMYGGFAIERRSPRDHLVASIKRAAVAMGVVPKTMRGKRLLKRVFLGRLTPVPRRLTEGIAAYRAPLPIDAADSPPFKVLYAVAHANG
jgi:ubiquinone/menaquinone biosynthesis C-methylase UbiE